ncbi:MAG TPA: hypothetical protein PLI09_00965 [Candidatus Hydrogenedentes bacterium]|nr:hypothetical protein [Candidatus Hydrogenedentota bacterium]
MYDMIRLLWKATLLVMLNALIGMAVLAIHDSRLHYARWETDSLLLTMPDHAEFGAVFLGSSHTYLFSRLKQHQEIADRELGMKTWNLALPSGGGIRPARFFLEYFWEQGNTARQVVYFLEPFVFYSSGANDAHKFIYAEPLRGSFLKKLVLDRYPLRSVLTYIRSKFTQAWFFQQPEPMEAQTYTFDPATITPERIAYRMETLYGDGLREDYFQRYAREFVRIVEQCRQRGVPLTVIFPPTLLGPEPGAPRVIQWLKEQQRQFGFSFHDFTTAMPDYHYYYNLDHLNTDGVREFMHTFVRPVLTAK